MSKAIAAQTVLVTGAGRGLGAAIATAFAREGAKVVVNYRNSGTTAQALADRLGDRAIALRADVTDAEAVRRVWTFAIIALRRHWPISLENRSGALP